MIVKLDPNAVTLLAREATGESDFVIKLYKAVYGEAVFDDDSVLKLDWPTCNRETWIAICDHAMEVTRRNKEHHMPGGTWMNQGFSSADTRPDGERLAFMEVYAPDLPSHPAVSPATEAGDPSFTGPTPTPVTPA